ncbi:helix-turn-helix domain-containing protein [Streptomyces mangrovisoli]|uniref:PucR C-terminal helix-turn-helix domain-containing protein n=1 Tax=Streptomyces mangrovisoli TaxID=1428628 RepID=A0A1J4NP20_9ACTN|nr:helix-turn-helix domain-containing protein [Streptomyces mangrovisoli]OIJ63874.1 hypothetical protein WN71_031165 [Streptomyces mangrovisoli]
MSASGGSLPLTLVELLHHGPLTDVTVHGPAGRDTQITAVRIVDRLDALNALRPGDAVVLTASAASAAWTVEMALRAAWEHAAACVVVAGDGGRTGSVGELAERLGIALLVVEGDALDVAVRIASAVARPEAGRTALVAEAARAVAAAGVRPSAVLSALHGALPATSVALTTPSGEVAAGRAAALEEKPGTLRVTVAVPAPNGEDLARLTARFRPRAAGWDDTVREVLGLAVAPLTAWAATERLAAERDGHEAAQLLLDVLDLLGTVGSGAPPSGAPGPGAPQAERDRAGAFARATALGWPLRGPFVVYAVRPDGPPQPHTGPLLTARWARGGPDSGPLVAHAGVWVSWRGTGPDEAHGRDPVADAERHLRGVLAVPGRLPRLTAAVAGPAPTLEDLGAALDDAVAALALARTGEVVRADRTGPAHLLAALPREALQGPARTLLEPVLAADRDGTLLRTLAVLLDVGGAPSAAALRLGVHRNTVTARLERLRGLGRDPDDPALRLPMHLACRVLLDDPDAPPDATAGGGTDSG